MGGLVYPNCCDPPPYWRYCGLCAAAGEPPDWIPNALLLVSVERTDVSRLKNPVEGDEPAK